MIRIMISQWAFAALLLLVVAYFMFGIHGVVGVVMLVWLLS